MCRSRPSARCFCDCATLTDILYCTTDMLNHDFTTKPRVFNRGVFPAFGPPLPPQTPPSSPTLPIILRQTTD